MNPGAATAPAGSVRLPPGTAEEFFRAMAVGDLIQMVP